MDITWSEAIVYSIGIICVTILLGMIIDKSNS